MENDNKTKSNELEFVSDSFKTTEKDLEEVKAGMKILGIDTLASQQIETKCSGTFIC